MRTSYRWAVVVSMLIVPACSAPSADQTWQSMTLVQSTPELVEISNGDGMREHGEGMVFEASLSDESGKAVGQLLGEHTIVDIPGKDAVGDPAVEERFTWMSLVLEEGDEIEVQGANTYPIQKKEIEPDAPQYRAITGGTGRYKGIRGQVKTTRNADGTYTHTLEYRLD